MESTAQPPIAQNLPQQVEVTILVEGGNRFVVQLQSNALLLQQLFETVVDQSENRAKRVFQIPINEGKAILCFPSDRLVGVITEPPLILQQQPAAVPQESVIPPGV